MQNLVEFQKSITKELVAVKNRVRNIIGNANWGEEGRYKEAVLKKVISSFLPKNLSIATGFIVRDNGHFPGDNNLISKQIDLIVYDNAIPVVFQEGDFVIVMDSAVRGIVEVKSNILTNGDSEKTLMHIVTKLNHLREFAAFNFPDGGRKKFIGVFSFDYRDEDFESEQIAEVLKVSAGFVNHISLGKDKFIRFWESADGLYPQETVDGPYYQKYNIGSLSFSYFISNLIHIVSNIDPQDRYWFSFPLPRTKEEYRVGRPIRFPNLGQ